MIYQRKIVMKLLSIPLISIKRRMYLIYIRIPIIATAEETDGFRVHEMYDFLKEKGIKTVDELFR